MRSVRTALAAACGVVLMAAACRGQAAGDARRAQIEAELLEGTPAQVDRGFTEMRQWLTENPADAENAFWKLRGNLLLHAEHAGEMQEMVELAKEGKKGNRYGIGYLYALQAVCLCQLDQGLAGAGVLRAGLKIDEAATASEAMADISRLGSAHKEKEAAQLLEQVVLGSGDLAVLESALQQRTRMLEASGQRAGALASARGWFNVSAVPRAATAANMLADLLGADRGARLRTEQADGARAPAGGPEVMGVTSPTMLAVAIDIGPFAEALAKLNDDNFANASRHAALLLAAGKADDALAAARKALDKATGNAANLRAAHDLIARCYKGQDGTTGRAAAYLASNGAVAAAPPVARGGVTTSPARRGRGPADPGMP